MPCNAVAFQRASITINENGQLTEKAVSVMTLDAAAKLLQSALKKIISAPALIRTGSAAVYCTAGNVNVTYRASGALEVSISAVYSAAEKVAADKLAAEVKDACLTMLTQGAGLLLQAKLQQVLQSKLQTSSVQRVANGSIVMKVTL